MSCPYLEGKILKRCAVLRGAMVLSIGELNDYCTTEQAFVRCKFFEEVKLDKKEDGQHNK